MGEMGGESTKFDMGEMGRKSTKFDILLLDSILKNPKPQRKNSFLADFGTGRVGGCGVRGSIAAMDV